VLARRGALRPVFECWNADAPAARPNHHPIHQRPRSPPRAHEPAASGAGETVLVWKFRRALRRRHAGDRYHSVKMGPFAMLDMYGTPRSPALHVVERYRLLDYEAAKEAQERGQRELSRLGRDPGLVPIPTTRARGCNLNSPSRMTACLPSPWSAAVSYRRPLGEWPEVACAENPMDIGPEHTSLHRPRTSQISDLKSSLCLELRKYTTIAQYRRSGPGAAVRASSADRPVCARLPTLCCVAANRRSGPTTGTGRSRCAAP